MSGVLTMCPQFYVNGLLLFLEGNPGESPGPIHASGKPSQLRQDGYLGGLDVDASMMVPRS